MRSGMVVHGARESVVNGASSPEFSERLLHSRVVLFVGVTTVQLVEHWKGILILLQRVDGDERSLPL